MPQDFYKKLVSFYIKSYNKKNSFLNSFKFLFKYYKSIKNITKLKN